MKIAITGDKGFIGKGVSKALSKEGHNVRGLKRNKEFLDDVRSLRHFVRNKNIIYHFAGVNRPENPLDYHHVNTAGTAGLIEATKKYGRKSTKIVFASSIQVYNPSRFFHKEDKMVNPSSIYGWSKKFAEDLVINSGFNYVIFRMSNVYGRGVKPYYNSVIATFTDLTKKGRPLTINNKGTDKKDFIYVDDVISAMLMSKKLKSGIYNLCTQDLVSIKKLVGILSDLLDKNPKVKFPPGSPITAYIKASNAKLIKAGWKSIYTITKGLKCTV
jgi:UDP-2-acetamido-2,6-beta-L-arabino-hexul-4-ose reductase